MADRVTIASAAAPLNLSSILESGLPWGFRHHASLAAALHDSCCIRTRSASDAKKPRVIEIQHLPNAVLSGTQDACLG